MIITIVGNADVVALAMSKTSSIKAPIVQADPSKNAEMMVIRLRTVLGLGPGTAMPPGWTLHTVQNGQKGTQLRMKEKLMDQGLRGMKGEIWVDNSKAPKPEPKPKPKPAPQSPKPKAPAPAPVAAPVPQPPKEAAPLPPAKPDTPIIQHIDPPRQAPATTLSAATQASPQPAARAPPPQHVEQRAPSSQPRSVRYPTIPPQDLSTLRRAEQYAQQLQAQLQQSTSPARVQVRVSMRSSPPSAVAAAAPTPDVRSAFRNADPVGYSPSSVVTSTESSDLSSSSTPSTPSTASVAPPRLRSEPPPPAYRGGVGGGGGGSVGYQHHPQHYQQQQRGYGVAAAAASPPPLPEPHTLPPAPPMPRYTPPAEAYRMPPPMRAGPAVGAVGVVCEAPQFTRQERRITTPSGGGGEEVQAAQQGPSVAAEEDAAGLLQLMTGSGELRALLEGERGGANLDSAQVRQLADKLLGYYTARMSEPHKEEVLHLLSVHLLAGHIAADTAQKQHPSAAQQQQPPTPLPAAVSTAATTTQTSRLPTPLLHPHHEPPPPAVEPEPEPEPEQRGAVPTPDGGFDASALLRPISSAPAPPSSPAERPVLPTPAASSAVPPAAAATADTADQALPPASAAPRGSLQTCRTNPTATPTASRRVTPAMRPDDSPPPPPPQSQAQQQAPPPSAAAAAAPSLPAYSTRFSHTPVSAPDPGRLLDPVFAEGQGYRTPGSSALSTRMRDEAKGRPVRAAALPAPAAAAATPEPPPVEPQQVAAAAAAAGAPAAAPRTYDRLVAHPSVSADQLGREITELFMALDPAVVPGAHYPAGPPAAVHQHGVPALGGLGAAQHSYGPSSVPQFPSYTAAAGPSPYPAHAAYPQGQLPHINVRVNYGGDSDAAGTVSASAETPSASRLSASPVHHRHQYATPSYHTASPSIPPPPPYDNDSDEDTVVGTFR